MRCFGKLLAAGVLALSAGSFSTGAQAAQVCFRLDSFPDTLRLEFGPLTDGHRNVYGTWGAPGDYTMPVSGAFELNVGSTTVRRLGIVGTNNNTQDFSGNLICGLDGIRGGPYQIQCSGGPTRYPGFTGTSLNPISCAGLPPPSNARALGAKSK
jgi:hypothetical protein